MAIHACGFADNQAAFVEQIARDDQERITLQRRSDERELENRERDRIQGSEVAARSKASARLLGLLPHALQANMAK